MGAELRVYSVQDWMYYVKFCLIYHQMLQGFFMYFEFCPVHRDETYTKVKGQWTYLYRAIDKYGNTVDFMLSEHRDEAAATAFFKQGNDWQKRHQKCWFGKQP